MKGDNGLNMGDVKMRFMMIQTNHKFGFGGVRFAHGLVQICTIGRSLKKLNVTILSG